MKACAGAELAALGLHPCSAQVAVLHAVEAAATATAAPDRHSTTLQPGRRACPSLTLDCYGPGELDQVLAGQKHCRHAVGWGEGLGLLRRV